MKEVADARDQVTREFIGCTGENANRRVAIYWSQ